MLFKLILFNVIKLKNITSTTLSLDDISSDPCAIIKICNFFFYVISVNVGHFQGTNNLSVNGLND